MDARTLENIKVSIRGNRVLYPISKALYYPIRMYHAYKMKRKIQEKIPSVIAMLETLNMEEKRVFYFGVPIHENLGDAAQMYCIRNWIRTYYPDRQLIEFETWPTYNEKVRRLLETKIKNDDIIITESGATFCNRHEDHGMHRYLLEAFTENRILFMPQTVDLSDDGEMAITARLFNAHPKAIFLARDPVSFDMVKKPFDKKRVFLCPDIVTTLIGQISNQEKRHGILVCKRIDGEKKYTDKHIEELLNQLRTISDVVDITDTNFDHTIEYTYEHLEDELSGKFKQFARYDVVLTDRYHGMIFSLIANTPVVVLPTTGHKVREGAKWLKQDYPDSIYFCETLDEAFRTINTLLSDHVCVTNPPIYGERYYSQLPQKIC